MSHRESITGPLVASYGSNTKVWSASNLDKKLTRLINNNLREFNWNSKERIEMKQ